jgi:Protein of unknown function (DUF3606)
MPDNKTKRAAQDATKINIREDYEVAYWTNKFGCTPQQLKDAVNKAGTGAEAVKKALSK